MAAHLSIRYLDVRTKHHGARGTTGLTQSFGRPSFSVIVSIASGPGLKATACQRGHAALHAAPKKNGHAAQKKQRPRGGTLLCTLLKFTIRTRHCAARSAGVAQGRRYRQKEGSSTQDAVLVL